MKQLRILKIPFLLFSVALLLRVLFVLAKYCFNIFPSGVFFYAADSGLYDELAQSLLRGEGMSRYGHPTAYYMPLYPIFLAGCYALFGRNFLIVGIVQSLLGALVCVFVYLMGKEVFNQRVGILAGTWAAVYYELVLWNSGQILTEPLYTFLITFGMLLLVRAFGETKIQEKNQQKLLFLHSGASGMLIGLASLTRPIVLGFGVVVAFWLFLRQSKVRILIFGFALILTMLPWVVRNSLVFHDFLLGSSEGGWVFYLGNNPHSTGGGGGSNEAIPALPMPPGLSETEVNRRYYQAAFQFIKEHPGRALSLLLPKLLNTWRPVYANSSLKHKLIAYPSYGALVIFAFLGLVMGIRRSEATKLMGLFVVYHILFHTLVTGEIRFRAPVEPVLIVFAAFGVVWFISFVKRKGFLMRLSTITKEGMHEIKIA